MQTTRNSTWFCRLAAVHLYTDISTLQSCLDSLHIWFCENGMALNASKSVAIFFGRSQRLKSLSGLKSVNVAGTVIPVSDKVKILGAALDSSLTMEPHTKTILLLSHPLT